MFGDRDHGEHNGDCLMEKSKIFDTQDDFSLYGTALLTEYISTEQRVKVKLFLSLVKSFEEALWV